MRLILHWLINVVALVVAAWLTPGIVVVDQTGWVAVAVMAAVLALVNALVRPILTLLSCGLIVITLGLFLLVVNAATFALASWICVNWLGVGFYVDGFWSALIASIIVSIVSFVLSMVLPVERPEARHAD